MKIIALGRNEIFFEVIKELSKDHQVLAIFTAKASPEYLKNEDDFFHLAQSINTKFFITQKEAEIISLIKQLKPDIGISINWPIIITENLLKLLPYGILNCHPGNLPRFRGNAATNWALLLNEKKIVFTIHSMIGGEVDSGEIICQEKMGLTNQTTINDINIYWKKIAPTLFTKAINLVSSPKRKSKKSEGKGFRCYPRLPIHSKIDWNRDAVSIDALIRSSTKPYSGAYSYIKINGKIEKVYIWKAKVIVKKTDDIGVPGHIIKNDKATGESYVYCGQGILSLSEVQYESKEVFAPGLVWNSIRMGFGIDLEAEIMSIQKYLK